MIFRWRLNTKSKSHVFTSKIRLLFQKELNLLDEVEFTKPRIVNLQTPNMMMMIEMIPINATDKVWQNNT